MRLAICCAHSLRNLVDLSGEYVIQDRPRIVGEVRLDTPRHAVYDHAIIALHVGVVGEADNHGTLRAYERGEGLHLAHCWLRDVAWHVRGKVGVRLVWAVPQVHAGRGVALDGSGLI